MVNRARMGQMFKLVGLLLLLMAAQQGAVVHELSHVAAARNAELHTQSEGNAEATCVLCAAFAQVTTPAFSHSFHIPLLVRFALERVVEQRYLAIQAAAPRPRSRGPPSLS